MSDKKDRKKTALVLGGGGGRGSYEAGVWKALRELGIEIDMVVGTSIGALNAVMVAQGDYDNTERLWREIELSDLFDIDEEKAKQLNIEIANAPIGEVIEASKTFFDKDASSGKNIIKLLEEYAPIENLEKATIPFGFAVTEFPAMEPRYFFSYEMPKEDWHKYVLASAATFPFSPPVEIGDKKYIDGGFRDQVPIKMVLGKGMDRIIAVDLNGYDKIDSSVQNAARKEGEYIVISTNIPLGSFLAFGEEIGERRMKLGYYDTKKRFGLVDGIDYCFEKDSFDKMNIGTIDQLAKTYHLDPVILYTPETFHKALKKKILNTQISLRKSPLKTKKVKDLVDKMEFAILVTFIAENMKAGKRDNKLMEAVTEKVFKEYKFLAEYILENDLLST